MRSSTPVGLLCSSLLLLACEPTLSAVPFAATSQPSRASAEQAARDDAAAGVELARDPRCSLPLRAQGLLIVEIQQLEAMLQKTPKTDPMWPGINIRLADDYGELSCVARKDRRALIAEGRGNSPEADKLNKMDRAAGHSALLFDATLLDKASSQCHRQATSLRSSSCSDALLYYVGYGLERDGKTAVAQKAYLQLIQSHQQSPFVPFAFFALAEIVRGEPATDPQNVERAERFYSAALGRRHAENEIYGVALLRLAMMHKRQGNEKDARREIGELAWLAQLDNKGTAACALQLAPSEMVTLPPGAWVTALESKCESGDARSCMDLGLTLERVGGPKDALRLLPAYTKACEGNVFEGCVSAGLRYQAGLGVVKDVEQARTLYKKACDSGDAFGCELIGIMGITERKETADDARALGYFIRGCLAGSASSCKRAADQFVMGVGAGRDEVRAAGFLETSCKSSDPWACIRLGAMYENGRGLGKDEARAKALYDGACNAGAMLGCTALGSFMERVTSLGRDEAAAAALYGKACDAFEATGCRRLGLMFEQGRGVAKDEGRAAAAYKRACASDGEGCRRYAQMLEEGRIVSKDEAKAAVFYTRGCNAGDGRSCYQIGRLFKKSADPEKDAIAAAETYTKACAAADGKACLDSGLLSASGLGVPVDAAKALVSFTRGCDLGQAGACALAGVWIGDGRGWPGPDMARSLPFHTKACETGAPVGCFHLGFAYEKGNGVEKDEARAVQLYSKACDAGTASACFFLGSAYSNGRGVAVDKQRANVEFARACSFGDEATCEMIKK